MNGPAASHLSVCAVVPAAGRGSRLGADSPKVFVPLFPRFTIWDALHGTLVPICDRIVLVLSPDGGRFMEDNRPAFSPDSFRKTHFASQSEPRGMGDAIFAAAGLWREAETILVVWGDQYNLSGETLRACLALHAEQVKPAFTLPLVRAANPYVEYVFDASGQLSAIHQSREGDACAPGGFADMGVFLLNGGPALEKEWAAYLAGGAVGARTGEINFLPFLVHLALVAGWHLARYECPDPREALGINTPDDLELAREILRAKQPRSEE